MVAGGGEGIGAEYGVGGVVRGRCLLRGLRARRHVFRPVFLLARVVAVTRVPAAVEHGLLTAVGAL